MSYFWDGTESPKPEPQGETYAPAYRVDEGQPQTNTVLIAVWYVVMLCGMLSGGAWLFIEWVNFIKGMTL